MNLVMPINPTEWQNIINRTPSSSWTIMISHDVKRRLPVFAFQRPPPPDNTIHSPASPGDRSNRIILDWAIITALTAPY
ncbi:hypothetical protein RRG08_048966 [Elysia crispata]|uniref:Uncharacterized protein n=1 Tax=Elysia crispata TaxID=231223 RepID=A0AAE0YCA4_9GAST|nr:hypothetical protein RRG08_048966 [Elysia crispata]